MTVEIRSNTELPSRREPITLRTSDGLALVGEWALPLTARPAAAVVTFHPLPTAGGFMDSHLLRKASNRLPALADLAVLRFNTRGTTSPHGTSEGAFDEARAERADVDAAIEAGLALGAPRLILLGWSFGTDLVLKFGRQQGVDAVLLLSPPLRYTTQDRLAAGLRCRSPLWYPSSTTSCGRTPPGSSSPSCPTPTCSASRAANTSGWGRSTCDGPWTRWHQ
jgi:pimeloyl-ACP methyl ester carboxylesterase